MDIIFLKITENHVLKP